MHDDVVVVVGYFPAYGVIVVVVENVAEWRQLAVLLNFSDSE